MTVNTLRVYSELCYRRTTRNPLVYNVKFAQGCHSDITQGKPIPLLQRGSTYM